MTILYGTQEVVLTLDEAIDLISFKLTALKDAKEADGSWNYDIENTENKLNELLKLKALV